MKFNHRQAEKAVITAIDSEGKEHTIEITDPELVRVSPGRHSCLDCEHRGSVPGSAHSCCNHPDIGEDRENPLMRMFAIFASVGRTPPIASLVGITKLGIKLKKHGVERGWANWPWDFDPIWIEACEGYEDITPKKIAEKLARPTKPSLEENDTTTQAQINHNRDRRKRQCQNTPSIWRK